MSDLEDAVRERRSIRRFIADKPVPRELVDEAMKLAVQAPSSSNLQPWHVVFASGSARERLVQAMLAQARSGPLPGPPIPECFAHIHHATGSQLYAAMGIARHDVDARREATLRNWEFFGAPLAAIVCMHNELGPVDSMAIGMFLQTLLLALTARGLGTCLQGSIASYPDIVRSQLGIPAEFSVLCGLAIGYPDPAFPANNLHAGREPVEAKARFVEH